MSTKADKTESSAHAPSISKKSYKGSLHKLQIELVKLQRHFIECNDKILIILEGRCSLTSSIWSRRRLSS